MTLTQRTFTEHSACGRHARTLLPQPYSNPRRGAPFLTLSLRCRNWIISRLSFKVKRCQDQNLKLALESLPVSHQGLALRERKRLGRPTAISEAPTFPGSETRAQEEESVRTSPAPQQVSPGPWLLVPKAPLLCCCLILAEAPRLTAHGPSSKSVFDLHLLAQQDFTRSHPRRAAVESGYRGSSSCSEHVTIVSVHTPSWASAVTPGPGLVCAARGAAWSPRPACFQKALPLSLQWYAMMK